MRTRIAATVALILLLPARVSAQDAISVDFDCDIPSLGSASPVQGLHLSINALADGERVGSVVGPPLGELASGSITIFPDRTGLRFDRFDLRSPVVPIEISGEFNLGFGGRVPFEVVIEEAESNLEPFAAELATDLRLTAAAVSGTTHLSGRTMIDGGALVPFDASSALVDTVPGSYVTGWLVASPDLTEIQTEFSWLLIAQDPLEILRVQRGGVELSLSATVIFGALLLTGEFCVSGPPIGVDDSDRDGVLDPADNCPEVFNPGQEDSDRNGVGDACNDAEDRDDDEFSDPLDNCPDLANLDQEDRDGDDVGDLCDTFPNDPDNEQAQCEADLGSAVGGLQICREELEAALSDPRSSDGDGDGEVDATDRCPDTSTGEEVDAAGCSRAQFCAAAPARGFRGRIRCMRSDWRNDEPAGWPRDCHVSGGGWWFVGGVCAPR